MLDEPAQETTLELGCEGVGGTLRAERIEAADAERGAQRRLLHTQKRRRRPPALLGLIVGIRRRRSTAAAAAAKARRRVESELTEAHRSVEDVEELVLLDGRHAHAPR